MPTIEEMERTIIRRVVDDALAAGCSISVFDGCEYTVDRSKDAERIMEALFTVDEDAIRIYDAAGAQVGWLFFVHGNDGHDVISDGTESAAMRDLLAGAAKLAEGFCYAEFSDAGWGLEPGVGL